MKLAVTLAFCFIVKVAKGNTVLQSSCQLDLETTVLKSLELLKNALARGECLPTCPDGWLYNKGSCYLYSNEPLTFPAAQRVCEDNGSHLVDINDEAENTFLKDIARQMTPRNWWTGLTDMANEGEWIWSDSSEPTFTDWITGEPDGHGDCVFLRHGSQDYKWSDNLCGNTQYFRILMESITYLKTFTNYLGHEASPNRSNPYETQVSCSN
ncbi:alpha-N-acetylgalactosamine-specific lectin-like [Mya arenaria]|uniref:alpha-N-acetylgalactosamine-specific lectin-like n=1 Tax=Mya arenaria TaxID=6604 RepID=UPI0022E2862B|nr:alpha-N-acetylgalactosamine-specific lectin-like [Mya arenaria]